MTVYLRPYNSETDSARLTELLSELSSRPVRHDWLCSIEALQSAGRVQFRITAAVPGAAGEHIVGFGETGRDPWMAPGTFWLDLLVAPEMRRRGVGIMLFDDLAQFAWELGATHLLAHLDEPGSPTGGFDSAGLRFARRRGFRLHPLGATLDLSIYHAGAYDEQSFCDLPDVPELAGAGA
jgi:GNAT superfamily N-acetyltransferase